MQLVDAAARSRPPAEAMNIDRLLRALGSLRNPDLPVPCIFAWNQAIYQVDTWFQIYRELEDEGNLLADVLIRSEFWRKRSGKHWPNKLMLSWQILHMKNSQNRKGQWSNPFCVLKKYSLIILFIHLVNNM